MGVSWTKEQAQVIHLRNRNILVSAAAGSGKTAVLVERIITRLTVDEPPIDVDQMLVVTFTEAAAAEMKERIRDAIEKKLEEQPENVHLQRQATLIHNAQVTTIHSFCLSVIRDYFHMIDLDPGFRIADEGELKLLRQDVLEEVLENCYTAGEQSFLDCIESFAAGRDDKKIEEIILQLYEFSRSNPEPEKWLRQCVKSYEVDTMEAFEASEGAVYAKESLRKALEETMALLEEGIRQCQEPDGPYMYADALKEDRERIQKLLAQTTMRGMYDLFADWKWKRFAANKDKSVSEELTASVKNIREEVKDIVGALKDQFFYEAPEELWKDMVEAGKTMSVLAGLVQFFADAFEEKKRSKHLIDFSDMEQYALRILTEKTEEGLIPSEAAKDYQKKFAEVMIDEYQDSNLIQEAILTSVSTVSEGNYNVFMVGDVKQSIYRFRLSRPELFMEKFNTYSIEESQKQRINLHKNFRSRREVLDSTNFVFEQIMTKELGEITYDEKAALYVGADYEEKPGMETEVLLVNTAEDFSEQTEVREASDRELEARAIAARIKQLVGAQPVFDKKSGAYCPAKYSDIVILTRSLKGWTDVFTEVLNREGIPTFTGSKEGYFETREIRLLLDYLRVLDNPRQDLPLAAVLKSMFAGLSSEEFAKIKCEEKEVPFYQAVQDYRRMGDDRAIQEKLDRCYEKMEDFRERLPYTAIHELLWQILDETGYGNYVAAMPGGGQRAANLEMLVEKAIAFEATSYKGLFNFVRYIEQLRKYDIDYGEANIADEQADTVRLMSIHKSKGLEFPIVIVAGMSKRFNMQDTTGSIVVHPELGVGVDAVDLEYRTKIPTFLKKVIQRKVQLENLGEELRVLYVALTRAKEKLILIGSISNLEKKLKSFASIQSREQTALPFGVLSRATSYFDWILPALFRNQVLADLLNGYGMNVPFTNAMYQKEVPLVVEEIFPEHLILQETAEEVEQALTEELLRNWDTAYVYDERMRAQIEEQFSYQYPYEAMQKMKLKFTVSELKKRSEPEEEAGEILYEEPEIVPLVPNFMREKTEPGYTGTLSGASRGTAYHKFLELLDFGKSYTISQLYAEAAKFCEEGKLKPEMMESIYYKDILGLLESPLGLRLRKAAQSGCLKKEQPFVLGVSADTIYPELLERQEEEEELLIVQGIIDVYFEEPDGIVVVDYKTDRAASREELAERYEKQLRYYGEVLERLTGKRVKEKIIYSFAQKEEVRV